ncbi:MAG TPA: hypothetical protein VMT37_11435 [Solirubrobacterales bacterium]|nr:hypothetical protein [Solirubrobacterales bacterium]
MNSLKFSERRGLMPKPLDDRLGRGVGGEYEATVTAGLLHNVSTLDITAQFHMRLIHAVDDDRGSGQSTHLDTRRRQPKVLPLSPPPAIHPLPYA